MEKFDLDERLTVSDVLGRSTIERIARVVNVRTNWIETTG